MGIVGGFSLYRMREYIMNAVEMDRIAIEYDLEYIMNIIQTRIFEVLYNEYVETDDDTKLKDFIRIGLMKMNK